MGGMESHEEERRKNSEKHEMDEVNVVGFIHKVLKLHEDFTAAEIHKVIGAIEVNGFEVPVGEENFAVALYPRGYLFQHDCVPNCEKFLNRERSLYLKAVVDVPKGTPLSISYTDQMWGTVNRQYHLMESKYFTCTCSRCSDPRELGTMFSAVRCNRCRKGYLLYHMGKNNDTPGKKWKCDGCDNEWSNEEMELFMEKIGERLIRIPRGDVPGYEAFIEKQNHVLHPNHFFIVEVTRAICESDLNATGMDLHRREDHCRRLLSLANILCPGLTMARGIHSYQLEALLSAEAEEVKEEEKDKKLQLLLEATKMGEEAKRCLENKHSNGPDVPIFHILQEDLKNLLHRISLHQSSV
ncbi:unnamed protein product [Darwinula stevensoni]|uniref:SET domain-containing protein n=1 Tax=Darwinula stevensoni TaxID=69355 RepID=A0A7R9A4P4_9CRUS|nr:unnamed protein product [Darwinula stevensoni]CAG0883805.1 unnamed protein product [Darwinula stevensoni]